jgi:hypothetical protein
MKEVMVTIARFMWLYDMRLARRRSVLLEVRKTRARVPDSRDTTDKNEPIHPFSLIVRAACLRVGTVASARGMCSGKGKSFR